MAPTAGKLRAGGTLWLGAGPKGGAGPRPCTHSFQRRTPPACTRRKVQVRAVRHRESGRTPPGLGAAAFGPPGASIRRCPASPLQLRNN
jgi:hypothetical protein